MTTIDHDTFHAMEIDGLYEELDGAGASALNAHAASCETCGPRFERLRRARQRGLAALSEQVSDDFESRVMAAVDAALAARAPLPTNVVAFPSRAPKAGSNAPPDAPAKVVPLFARPWFAAAASMFLIIGAAAILSQKAMSKRDAAPTSLAENAPTAGMPADEAPAAAATATAAPLVAEATPAASFAGVDTKPGAPPANVVGRDDDGANGALALNDQRSPAKSRAPARAAKPSLAAPPPPSPAAAAAPAVGGATSTGSDLTFAAAKQLYDARRYREAQAKFEVLASGNPEAALYAARCVQRTSGCGAAAPRFDQVASVYAGTSVGTRAAAEANSCYAALGGRPGAGAAAPNARAAPKAAAPAPAATATEAPADTDTAK